MDNEGGMLRLEEEPRHKPDDKGTIINIATLQPIGEVFMNGLSNGYDTTFPPSFSQYGLSSDEFASSIDKINEALLDHWPCLPCQGFAYGCCLCTLGLSLKCTASMVSESRDRAELQIQRINNQQNYKTKNIQWSLVINSFSCRPTSYIKIIKLL